MQTFTFLYYINLLTFIVELEIYRPISKLTCILIFFRKGSSWTVNVVFREEWGLTILFTSHECLSHNQIRITLQPRFLHLVGFKAVHSLSREQIMFGEAWYIFIISTYYLWGTSGFCYWAYFIPFVYASSGLDYLSYFYFYF